MTDRSRRMKSLCLTIARFTVCAWVGAAALFVVAGVREVTSQQLDSTARDLLVPLRFGPYYLFGFGLVGIAIITGWLATHHPAVTPWRMRLSVVLLIAAVTLMVFDYFFIYSPLVDMITPPGQARPANFITYHQWSERINGLDVGLCLIAGVLMLWPRSKL